MDVLVDITGITLETERLILRPWLESDLEDFFTYPGPTTILSSNILIIKL